MHTNVILTNKRCTQVQSLHATTSKEYLVDSKIRTKHFDLVYLPATAAENSVEICWQSTELRKKQKQCLFFRNTPCITRTAVAAVVAVYDIISAELSSWFLPICQNQIQGLSRTIQRIYTEN